MRGKQARAAESRRDRAALVAEAETATRRAERAEADLAALKTKSEADVVAARARVREVERQLVEGTAPHLDELRSQADRLRRERDAAYVQAEEIGDKWGLAMSRMVELIMDAKGVSHTVAVETVTEFMGKPMTIIRDGKMIDAVRTGKLTHEQAVEIDRVRYGNKRLSRLPEEVADAVIGERK